MGTSARSWDKRPRVLIVDDEQETRALLGALLEEDGIEVVGAAADGAQAVSMAETLDPDVILMDIRMPEMDGVQATRQIKIAHPDIQVIFLTFYGDFDSLESADAVGVFCYLVKGCPPSMIVEMIRRAWGQRKQSDAPQFGHPTRAGTGSPCAQP